MSQLEYVRSRSVQLSHRTYWCLLMMTRATNAELDKMSPSATVDKLTDSLLLAHIENTHPELLKLYKRRKDIEDEAQELLIESKTYGSTDSLSPVPEAF